MGVLSLNLNFLLTHCILGGILKYWFLNLLIVTVLLRDNQKQKRSWESPQD